MTHKQKSSESNHYYKKAEFSETYCGPDGHSPCTWLVLHQNLQLPDRQNKPRWVIEKKSVKRTQGKIWRLNLELGRTRHANCSNFLLKREKIIHHCNIGEFMAFRSHSILETNTTMPKPARDDDEETSRESDYAPLVSIIHLKFESCAELKHLLTHLLYFHFKWAEFPGAQLFGFGWFPSSK